MNLYQEILDAAPNGTVTAGGDLHEEIWFELLKLEDPSFHNVRLARGDGGIDGITFIDPASGDAHIVQAKYFQDLSDDGRRAAVVKAFLTALRLDFVCKSWELLLPRQVSHTELEWLMMGLKPAAQARLAEIHDEKLQKLLKKKKPTSKAVVALKASQKEEANEVESRLRRCELHYRDGDDLLRLLRRHPSLAASLLPKSNLALEKALKEAQEARAEDRRALADTLQYLRQDVIRHRQVEARAAVAALKILNQGWTNHIEGSRYLMVMRKGLADVSRHASEVAAFTESKAEQSFRVEALAPGVSEAVSKAHYRSRMLQQVAVAASVDMADDDALNSELERLAASLETVRSIIADALQRIG